MLTETSNVPSSKVEGGGRAIPAVTRVPSFASARTVERFAAVVGPPAAGKSTVTGALADRIGARVFRLREFAHEFRSRPAADQQLFGGLLPRRGDEPQCFAARLARFRRRIPAIRRATTALHLPYRAVDATGDPGTCLQSVTMALAATEPLAHLFASRREHL